MLNHKKLFRSNKEYHDELVIFKIFDIENLKEEFLSKIPHEVIQNCLLEFAASKYKVSKHLEFLFYFFKLCKVVFLTTT